MKRGFKPLKNMSIIAVSAAALGLLGCSHAKVDVKNKDLVCGYAVKGQLCQNSVRSLRDQGVSVTTMGETTQILIASDQLFVEGSSNLNRHSAGKTLANVADYIKSFSTEHVSVAAYSDNRYLKQAPANRKVALTERQAQVVASQLWSDGVDTRLLVAKGFGAKHAVAWNGTVKGRSDNRRVVISFRFYATQQG